MDETDFDIYDDLDVFEDNGKQQQQQHQKVKRISNATFRVFILRQINVIKLLPNLSTG